MPVRRRRRVLMVVGAALLAAVIAVSAPCAVLTCDTVLESLEGRRP